MAVQYTNAEELIRAKDYHRKGGKVDMCEALTALIDEGRCEGIREGIKEGIREGEARFGRLTQILLDAGKTEELSRAVNDSEYREHLYRESGL